MAHEKNSLKPALQKTPPPPPLPPQLDDVNVIKGMASLALATQSI